MRVGLTSPSTERIVEQAEAAEAGGFDYFGCGEHLFFHGPTPNSFIHLAAAAGATKSIRLISSIALLPLYPPAIAAKLVATLDKVSNGRFDFGVGAGGEFPPEFHAVGIDPATRFRRLEESLLLMESLFTEGPTTFQGEFVSVDGLTLYPRPVQVGGPPVWLGGRKPGALRRAARYADVWLPYMSTPESLQTGLDEVKNKAEEFGRSRDEVTGSLLIWTCVDEDGDWAREHGIRVVSEGYEQDFAPLADKYLAVGTPEEIVARLREFEDAGAESVLIQLAADDANRDRVVTTLIEQVLPKLQQPSRRR
ncbi:LLM class flavin-dependent oxidoreductase [Rhodococcus sp. NPDC127530]|uniref:LLM class flavin-dependent oxidoreductase n=1 Tax=unclassified Rhodococcus (in: high G+C Gram-positive bacteria) TaxID=192944 RepID=UPI00362B30F1